ncbi:MAG: hypothetical protein AB8H47_04895 [Bacteroidia bacterium]
MKSLFSTSWLIFIPLLMSAQAFQSGTIVFKDGDSLQCQFRAQFTWEEEPFLTYIDPHTDEQSQLMASDLVAFGNLERGYWYLSRELEIELYQQSRIRWLFLESIISGRVSLYKTGNKRLGEHFFIENSAGEFTELINRKYQEIDVTKVTRTRFDHAYLVGLQRALMGCMEVAKNVKDYAFNEADLRQAVMDYHQCLETPYQVMTPPPSPVSLPKIGLKLALSAPFATTIPTAFGERVGWEAGLSIRWSIPKTRERFTIQVDGVYQRSWGLAQVRNQAFLSPISVIRISPLLQQQFRWDANSVFINLGYDWFLFERNIELAYPEFRQNGYLRWLEIPKHLFAGAGYIYHAPNGHLYQFESRIRFTQFILISLGASFYW